MELDHFPDTYHLLELIVCGNKAMRAGLEAGDFFAGHDGEDDACETIEFGEELAAAIRAWQDRRPSSR